MREGRCFGAPSVGRSWVEALVEALNYQSLRQNNEAQDDLARNSGME